PETSPPDVEGRRLELEEGGRGGNTSPNAHPLAGVRGILAGAWPRAAKRTGVDFGRTVARRDSTTSWPLVAHPLSPPLAYRIHTNHAAMTISTSSVVVTPPPNVWNSQSMVLARN